jgi:argininosuccinate lyase
MDRTMTKQIQNTKLWDPGRGTSEKIEKFTAGRDRELDLQLAEFDILGTLAHVAMLRSVKLLKTPEWMRLKRELLRLYKLARQGEIKIDRGVEDIHSQIELILTRRLGETGKKIHLGRSRNDQVLVDLKLYSRQRIRELVKEVKSLFDLLLALSTKYKNALLPGYTHLQAAMPSSFGLWFAAYAESLLDDTLLLQAAYRVVNKNPLGSAAGYGSSFPIDRNLTTKLLGFDDLHTNSVYAQMSRGKTERIVGQAIASVASTVARLCMDVTLYLSQNFNFISFPDRFMTGSSIMPHKKNPDVFEIVRGRCNRLQTIPVENILVTANLPSGYHRDLQILKEHFLFSFNEIIECLEIIRDTLQQITVRKDILQDKRYKYIFSVEAIQQQVLAGKAFRDAYRDVHEKINKGDFTIPAGISYTHIGSIGNPGNARISKAMQRIITGFHFDQGERALNRLLK